MLREDFKKLPALLTIKETAQILNVHPNTLRNWDRGGRLKSIRMGSRRDRRYFKEDIMKIYFSK